MQVIKLTLMAWIHTFNRELTNSRYITPISMCTRLSMATMLSIPIARIRQRMPRPSDLHTMRAYYEKLQGCRWNGSQGVHQRSQL